MTIDLRLGDCLELMKALPDKSVDAVITDPPYNVGLDYGATTNDKMSKEQYTDWLKRWYAECRRISRYSVVVFPGMVSVPIWIADIERTHFLIAWTKQNNCSRNYIGRTSGFQTWEPILIFGKSKNTIIRDSFDCPISKQRDVGNHPCPKPLRLLEWLVPQFVDENDTILDPFMGSGTTGVACVKLNRNFIGMEINPQYFEIAQKRIEEAERQMSMQLA